MTDQKNKVWANYKQEILDRLTWQDIYTDIQNQRASGNNWISGKCPLHADSKNSFGFHKTNLAWVCFGGCGKGSVFDFIAHTSGNDFKHTLLSVGDRLGIERPTEKKPAFKWQSVVKRFIAYYDYRNEKGSLVYRVCRTKDKEFFQCHPSKDNPDLFEWGMSGVNRVLYRLTQTQFAINQGVPIFIVEGEKDCDNAASAGIIATTCIGGNGNWIETYTKQLSGGDIILIPDNDNVGKQHMQEVANELSGNVKSCRVLELPNLPPKGDLSDWLLNGGDSHCLLNLAAAIPEWKPVKIEAEPVNKKINKPCPYDLAIEFLVDQGLHGGHYTYIYWREDFYRWTGTCYVCQPAGDVKSNIIRWLQANPVTRKQAGARLCADVTANLIGILGLESSYAPPVSMNGLNISGNIMAMADNLVNLDDLIARKESYSQPHTPEYFNTVSLPYVFDPAAECPIWYSFLDKVQPDPDTQNLLQEWFGYNLIMDTTREKWMLFTGEGANGKTVTCTVLRELLGPDNVSSVPLEAFNPVRTFALSSMFGKLANIVEEMGEIHKAEEGMLKQIVTGALTTAERKFRDAFVFKPTARLTFATNILPRFVDRSDGLWRRLILMPFDIQIPQDEQDNRLINADWWRESGELAGIFCWAIEGLARLKTDGFTQPKYCEDAKRIYQVECNPARAFIEENTELEPSQSIPTSELYKKYSKHIIDNGGRPLGALQFSKEVGKFYPNIECTKNARFLSDGSRSRLWIGINGLYV